MFHLFIYEWNSKLYNNNKTTLKSNQPNIRRLETKSFVFMKNSTNTSKICRHRHKTHWCPQAFMQSIAQKERKE